MTAVDVHAFEVTFDDATLRGEWAGEGAAIVLLHAGICDRRMWDAEFAALAERYRVVRYDLRGIGDSVPPASTDDRPFSHHTDLLALLDHLGIASATLVGASFGGRTAIDLAIATPERVDGLVVVCASPGGSPWDVVVRASRVEIDEALDGGDIAGANELELRLWVDGPRRDADVVDPDLRAWVGSMNAASLAVTWTGAGEQLLDPPAADRLDEIGCPALVIVGDLHVPGVVGAGERMAAQIPSARLVRLPDAAHLPSLEQPGRFLAELTAFLPVPDRSQSRFDPRTPGGRGSGRHQPVATR